MRIPPLYRLPSWQRFLSGMALGGIISWMIFVYMFGTMQEKQSALINEQVSEISELEKEMEFWQGEFKKLNEELEKELTVQEIEVYIKPNNKIDLTRLQKGQIADQLKEHLNVVKAKKLETVSESKDLLRKAIESKVFTVDSKKYRLRVIYLELLTTIYIEVSIDLA